MNQRTPNRIDKRVGVRLRMRRLMLGMSQERLGDALGLAFQQVQKYEKGTNRISVSRLLQIAEVLEVRPSFFFDDAPDALGTVRLPSNETTPTDFTEFIATADSLALIKAFSQIPDAELCRRIVELVETLAGSQSYPEKSNTLIDRAGRCVEATRLALPFRPIEGLAQDQKAGRARRRSAKRRKAGRVD